MTASSEPAAPSASLLTIAEAALTALTLAGALGLARLFSDSEWMGPMVVAGLGSHGVAVLTRRAGWTPLASAWASGAGLVLAASWTVLVHTTAYGVPTTATWTAAGEALSGAWETFRTVVAPTESEPGLVLAAVVGVWVAGFVADTAAFRLGATVESLVPSATLFIFSAALGADQWRRPVTALYLAALLAAVLAERALRQAATPTWLAADTRSGARAVLRGGALLACLGVAGALLVGPALPGAEAEPVVPWRATDREGPGARVTISPLVDIKSRLVDQSPLEVFTVRASDRAYWRLTSLETFDGRIWSSRGSYRPAGGELPEGVPSDAPVKDIRQQYEVSLLASIWLPGAYEPRVLRGADGVRYDPTSGSLLTESETSDGLSYELRSAVPLPTRQQLEQVPPTAPQEIIDEYLALPEEFSPQVAREAVRVTAGATTPYGRALALQDHFRGGLFEYDLSVEIGHDGNAIEQFLFEERRGYCEQFAGAYAAMARVVGLPARVAVGFTPGELDEDGVYHVRGANAHSWPEVYLDGYGWVAFEPTPGRGMPGAEGYTGVPEAQASGDDPSSATTVPAPATTTPDQAVGGPGETTIPELGSLDAGGDTGGAVDGPRSPWPGRIATVLAGGLLAAGLWVAVVALATRVQRDRRRSGAASAGDRVRVAWLEAGDALARQGAPRMPWETPTEYAERAAGSCALDRSALTGLARATAAADYAVDPVPDEVADRAAAVARSVERTLADRATWKDRLRWAVDPRPLVTRTPRLVVTATTAEA